MIHLKDVIQELKLEVVAGASHNRPVRAGYASDLLSCVMGRAGQEYLWVTLQSHVNVVAVASLLGLAGVIITEGKRPDTAVIERAEEEGVALMLTSRTTFAVVAELSALGVRGEVGTQ
jgi:hypothetical protein